MKLSGAMHSVSQLINETTETAHCCSTMNDEKTCDSADKKDSSDHEKGCCEDGNCHCICCLHVVYFTSIEGAFAQNQIIEEVVHYWNFNYYKEFQDAIFHPPLV